MKISSTKTVIAAFAFAALLGGSSYYVLSQKTPAPQVQFSTLAGEKFTTADLKGKVVLVNFWATSCAPCVKEMPRMAETWRKFNSRGFEVVAVAMDYDRPDFIANFSKRFALPFKIAFDSNGSAAKAFGDVRVVPTTFLIDREGRIIREFLGEADFEKLDVLLESILKRT